MAACIAVPLLLLSAILYVVDVSLDTLLAIRHFVRGHNIWWGSLTVTFIILSWLFTLGRAFWEWRTNRENRKEKSLALIAAGKYYKCYKRMGCTVEVLVRAQCRLKEAARASALLFTRDLSVRPMILFSSINTMSDSFPCVGPCFL